jgi:catechol 2,3-dioxygenase-like lactoylglutathione lyase family enzyme
VAIFKSKACQFIGIGPVIPVPDVEAAVAYYCDQLGFDRDFVIGEPPDHGSVTRGRVGIQFTLPEKPFQPHIYPGWFYLFVDDIDNIAASYEQRGLEFTQPLGTRDHGMREFEIKDLNGYCLRFGQYL